MDLITVLKNLAAVLQGARLTETLKILVKLIPGNVHIWEFLQKLLGNIMLNITFKCSFYCTTFRVEVRCKFNVIFFV